MFPAAVPVLLDDDVLRLRMADGPALRGAAPDGADLAALGPPPLFPAVTAAWLTDPFAMSPGFGLVPLRNELRADPRRPDR